MTGKTNAPQVCCIRTTQDCMGASATLTKSYICDSQANHNRYKADLEAQALENCCKKTTNLTDAAFDYCCKKKFPGLSGTTLYRKCAGWLM